LKRLAETPGEAHKSIVGFTFEDAITEFLLSDESPRSAGQRVRYVQLHDLLCVCLPDLPFVGSFDGTCQRRFKVWMLEQVKVDVGGGTLTNGKLVTVNGVSLLSILFGDLGGWSSYPAGVDRIYLAPLSATAPVVTAKTMFNS
jgi:hypothetical protein